MWRVCAVALPCYLLNQVLGRLGSCVNIVEALNIGTRQRAVVLRSDSGYISWVRRSVVAFGAFCAFLISGERAFAVYENVSFPPTIAFSEERRGTGIQASWNGACASTLASLDYWEGNTHYEYRNPAGIWSGGSAGCSFDLRISQLSGGQTIVLFDGPVFNSGWAIPKLMCPSGSSLNASVSPRACQRPRFIGIENPLCFANPVLAASGAKTQSDVEFAYSLAGEPLVVRREFSSKDVGLDARTFSAGWYLPEFDRRLRFEGAVASPTKVHAVRTPTVSVRFGTSSGAWASDPEGALLLRRDGPGWQVIDRESLDVEFYSDTGVLTRIDKKGARTLALVYSDSSTPPSIAPGPGYLIAVNDPAGRSIQMTRDAAGRVSQLTDPSGASVSYEYQGHGGALSKVTYPDGSFRAFVVVDSAAPADLNALGGGAGALYPAASATQAEMGSAYQLQNLPPTYLLFGFLLRPLASMTDERGVAVGQYAYDASGRAISSEKAGGIERHEFSYSGGAHGPTQTVSVTGPLGAVQVLAFSTAGARSVLTSASQAAGAGCAAATSSASYEPTTGRLDWSVDFSGRRTCRYYDGARNLETSRVEGIASGGCSSAATVGTEQRLVSTQWHPDWALRTKVAEPKKVTTLVYNGQVYNGTTQNCAAGAPSIDGKPYPALCRRIEQATSDENGNQAFGATAVGVAREWIYTYNTLGQVLTVNGPRTDVNDTTTYAYYAANDSDPNKRLQLASVTNALGKVTQVTAYNGYGQPLTIVDPNNVTTTRTYDARRRLLSEQVAGETTQFEYDPAGNLTKVTQPDGAWVSYTYDAAARLTQAQDNLGNLVVYTLDNASNRVMEEVKDPAGVLRRRISRVYDALDRLQAVTGGLQ